MAQMITRFAYLMNRLGVKAGVLAQETGINKTLISRGKTGRRRLSATSAHAEKIVDYLLGLDHAEATIGRTLAGYGLTPEMGALRDNLIFWISEQDIPVKTVPRHMESPERDEYTANYYAFLGFSGLRKAVATCIDYIMSHIGKRNILVVMRKDYRWSTADPEFLHHFWQQLQIAFENGITFTVFTRDGFSVSNNAHFVGPWLAAQLKERIRCYFFEEEDGFTSERLLCVAKNNACLTMRRGPSVQEELYVSMFTDVVAVNYVYDVCIAYKNISRLQFKHGFLGKPGNFFKNFPDDKISDSACYVFSHRWMQEKRTRKWFLHPPACLRRYRLNSSAYGSVLQWRGWRMEAIPPA